MKWLSNTLIAAIFAVVLTAIVAVSLKIPFFKDKESQTRDEMMLLCYNLHAKISPIKLDPHLVFVPIDEISLKEIGAWPFNRSVHGQFLQALAPEKPKVVGWDILFTEAHDADPNAAPAQPPTTTPAPPDTTPTSPPPTPAPAPPDTTPASPPPATPPNSTPAVPETPPAPSAPSTNAPGSAPTTTTSLDQKPSAYLFGDAAAAAPSSSAPAAPSPAPSPPVAPADAPSAPTPPATPPPPAVDPTTPASVAPGQATAPATSTPDQSPPAPAAPASNSPGNPPAANPPPPTTPPPAADTSSQAAAPEEGEDQVLIDGVSMIPNLVTAAARDTDDTTVELKAEDLLPTSPIKQVKGDITKLLSAKNALLPFPALRKKCFFGFADEDIEGAGGVRRTLPLVVNINGMVLPSFDFQVLMQYWGVTPDQVVVDLGHEITVTLPDGSLKHIPIDERGLLIINYRARFTDFPSESYAWMGKGLVDKGTDQQSPERDHLPPITNNIVIVGVTFAGTDASPTPLDLIAPLVSTHLNLLNNVLQHDFLRAVSGWVWIPIYALIIFGLANWMLRVRILPMIAIAIASMLVLAVGAFAALWFGNLLVPVAMPEIGLLLLAIGVPSKGFFGEEREKIRIRAAMSAYLSEKVMTQVLAHPDNVKLGGIKQVITIMFCDIRGFTKYCDNRDSAEVMAVLNDYMEEMTKVVFKYDGTVDKYIGDCIMAFWNAPQPQVDHAQRAVCCAMEMRYALANFKTRRAGKDTELFECGIGIHTGEALVGNMGSSLKRNYTAMGSTVNLGARLEALTKRLNERILISQDTLNALTGDFPITDRGEALVPGFTNAIHVYAVGADQDISSALKVGRVIAGQQEYTAEEASEPIWKPAPLPADADPNP